MKTRMVVSAALLLFPVITSAQEATSSEFRPGQWALQFRGISGLVGFGIMRFSSPRTAWIMNVDVNARLLNGTATSGGTSSDANDHDVFVQAGIGKRFYQSIRSKVRSFQSIGVAGSYQNQEQSSAFGTTFKTKSWAGGLEGQVGGAYWLTSNISLGGTASVGAGYVNQEVTSGGTQIKQHGVSISGVDVALVLGIYF